MERTELIALLGLSTDATDEQIKAAMKQNKEAAEQAQAAAANAEQTKKQKAEAFADKAIVDKKIEAKQRPLVVNMAIADYDSAVAFVDSLNTVPKLSTQLNTAKLDVTVEASRKDWDLEKYLEKDPEAYAAMKVEDPARAQALEKAYFANKK